MRRKDFLFSGITNVFRNKSQYAAAAFTKFCVGTGYRRFSQGSYARVPVSPRN